MPVDQTKPEIMDARVATHISALACSIQGCSDRIKRLPPGCAWPVESFDIANEIANEAEALLAAANQLKQAIGWYEIQGL